MKKMIALAGIGLAMIIAVSCGSNPRKDTNNPAEDSLTAGTGADKTDAAQDNVDNPRALTNDPAYAQGAVLVANNDCKTCHALDKKTIGPAYNQVADKYSNTPGMQSELAHKIIAGGYGRWGTVAMPAHPNVSEPDANEMAKYILSLKTK